MNMLKNNTKYLVMWDSLNATQTSTSNTEQLIGIYYVDTSSQNIGTSNNNTLCATKRSLIFDTKNFDVTKVWLKIHATLNNTETGTTTVTGLRVFEYDDYLRSVDLQSIGWFSGTKNVAVEPIKTCSKNLYPYGDINFTPVNGQVWHDGKGKEGIQAHAGGLAERHIGQERGEQTADGGGNAGGYHYAGLVHTGHTQIGRVDEDDVRHRKEGGDTGQNFGFDIGTVGFELKQLFHFVAPFNIILANKNDRAP